MSTPELTEATEIPSTKGRKGQDGQDRANNAPSSDNVTPCKPQLDNIETSMFTKTPEHSFQKIRKFISSASDPHYHSTANGGSPMKKTCQQSPRERAEEALCKPKQEADRTPPCAEAIQRDDYMIGGSTAASANGGLRDDSTSTHVIRIERNTTMNATGKLSGSTSRRILVSDGGRRTERTLAMTSSDHVTSVRSLLLRTNSTTSSVTHLRSTARLTSFSDTNLGRNNGSEQRGDQDPNSAQMLQEDIDRSKSPYPTEPDSVSTGVGKFSPKTSHQPPSEADECNPQKSRDESDAMSISTRTVVVERAPPPLLPLAAAYRRTERPNARESGTITGRAASVIWPTAGGVSGTRTGTSLLGRLESTSTATSGGAPIGLCCRAQTHSINTDHTGLARVTKLTREGPPKLREIRGCDVAGEERTLLGEVGTPHRLLGRISEHKGVLYQRIPWDGCIQVSSTGMNRVMTESRRAAVAAHDGSKEINITIPVAAPSTATDAGGGGGGGGRPEATRGVDSVVPTRPLPYAEGARASTCQAGDADDRYSWMLDTRERVGLQHNYSSKAVVMMSMPSGAGMEAASTHPGPAMQSRVCHQGTGQQDAQERSMTDLSATAAREGSTGPARGWRRGSLRCDDGDRPPRKQRERSQSGRRAGSSCAPKRSPRLLLKTHLQGDKSDNHSDDYVYMPLRRGDETRGGTGSGSGGHARCKARHRAASATAAASLTSEEAAAASRVFFDESTPMKCGLGGGYGPEDLLAVMTRSKSKTPVRAGAISHSMFDVMPDPSPRKRRYGGTELLGDTRLGKHACLLWSSEQRRRFQQEHANATGEELDAIMRRYWELLPDKDKLRYYQRARNAVSDRFRGSTATHRQGGRDAGSRSASERFDSTERFHHLPAAQQYRVLKEMLVALQRRLTAPDYHNFIRNYVSNFRRTAEHLYRRQRHTKHSGGVLRATNELWQRQLCAIPSRMLYSSVKEAQKNSGVAGRCRRATLRRQTDAFYRALVCDLIDGQPVQFPDPDDNDDDDDSGATTTRSAMLSEILVGLADIDKEEVGAKDRLAGADAVDTTESATETAPTMPAPDVSRAGAERRRRVDAIETELRCGSLAGYMHMHLGGTSAVIVPDITNKYVEKRILNDSRTATTTALTSHDVDTFFRAAAMALASDAASDRASGPVAIADLVLAQMKAALYRALSGLDGCCSLGDPSCMLNDLLVLETMRRRDVECRFQRLLRHYDDNDDDGNATRQYKCGVAT